MQGRLSPILNGKIQEFPWKNWREEFEISASLGFELMEWTLDQEGLYENPLMTFKGQNEIKRLSRDCGVAIPSLTGDCFMQTPFWKLSGIQKKELQKDFLCILDGCANIGICQVIVPLVDNGRIDNDDQLKILLDFFQKNETNLSERGIQILFESDLAPLELDAFISKFHNVAIFGINYDIGNSAALGFDFDEECAAYGGRILNVHVKDRILNGSTVPLGDGNADFNKVFNKLKLIRYGGNYILQTARANDGDHSSILRNYKSMIEEWIFDNGS